ncbi:hypothetical protein ACFWP0_21875 [Achromobacter sp. NPDC058515]|uniref:hypothetical protein n=1 Tax=Achromobacter sp. NPDC058515 TaxID=3346533 RepID=UPI003654A7BC
MKFFRRAASEKNAPVAGQEARNAGAPWGRRFFWHLCLYIGVILVFVLQAQPTTGSGGPIKVEFQYQQF